MKRDDLWHFAAGCYARPGIEAVCLELQSAGADVCLLLAGAWLEGRGVSCSAARLEIMKQLSADWRVKVVAPLRDLRQAWREAATDDSALARLRKGIKALEQDAERVQLDRLAKAAQHWSVHEGTADWLDQLCTELIGEPSTQMDVLRQAAFAQLDAEGGA